MQKWEYLKIERWREYEYDDKLKCWNISDWEGEDINLESLGFESWELVSTVPINNLVGAAYGSATTNILYFFKRPIEE